MKDNQIPKGAVRAQQDTAAESVEPPQTPPASSTEHTSPTPPGAGVTADPAPSAETPSSVAPKPRYTVAEGKSITSLKGIIDAGGEVRPEYFAVREGEQQKAQQLEALTALVAAGVVVDNQLATK